MAILNEKIKWKIISTKKSEDDLSSIKIRVNFLYGLKEAENTEVSEESNLTTYTGFETMEELTIPYVMSKNQIINYLDTYWGNKYGLLDTNYSSLYEIEGLTGLTSN